MSSEACPNCGSILTGRFCADCGQKRLDAHEYALAHFVGHALHDLTHLDAKVLGSIVPLVAKPGLVTRDYLEGRRGRYLRPLQTFIILNILFFFIGSQLGMWRMTSYAFTHSRPLFFAIPAAPLFEQKLRESGKSREAFTAEVDERLDHQKRSLLLTIVPVFAGVVALLYVGSRRRYIEHLIFSIHFYSFWMIVTLAVPLVFVLIVKGVMFVRHAIAPSAPTRAEFHEGPFLLTMFVGSWAWLYAALRRVYDSSRLGALVKAGVLSFALMLLLLAFRDLVFLSAVLTA